MVPVVLILAYVGKKVQGTSFFGAICIPYVWVTMMPIDDEH